MKDRKYEFAKVKHSIVPVSTIIDSSITTFFDYTTKYTLKECKGRGMMNYKLVNKATGKGGRQGERVYDLNKCGVTICASGGGVGQKTGFYDFDGKIRTLSVKEALLMFGFDATYKYDSLLKEKDMLFYLGNSIVVNVLEELIKGI